LDRATQAHLSESREQTQETRASGAGKQFMDSARTGGRERERDRADPAGHAEVLGLAHAVPIHRQLGRSSQPRPVVLLLAEATPQGRTAPDRNKCTSCPLGHGQGGTHKDGAREADTAAAGQFQGKRVGACQGRTWKRLYLHGVTCDGSEPGTKMTARTRRVFLYIRVLRRTRSWGAVGGTCVVRTGCQTREGREAGGRRGEGGTEVNVWNGHGF
jgi:hypothetical protein